MKSIAELDHYELLEISRSAGANEIERAYRLARQTYAEDSLALYSVFENVDAEAIRGRLDDAYQVLSDPELREDYDRDCAFEVSTSGSCSAEIRDVEQSGSYRAPQATTPARSADEAIFDAFDEIVDDFDALEEEGGGDYDGVRLRRARLFRGYEIDDISDVTKVSGAHLRNIEEENFSDLPADVYVRGFVTAYAKTIGLDPNIVVPGYMARVEQSRDTGQRGRFLGRH